MTTVPNAWPPTEGACNECGQRRSGESWLLSRQLMRWGDGKDLLERLLFRAAPELGKRALAAAGHSHPHPGWLLRVVAPDDFAALAAEIDTWSRCSAKDARTALDARWRAVLARLEPGMPPVRSDDWRVSVASGSEQP